MFTVYVLYSQKHQKIYIGYTSNLDARIKSHNELGTKGWTIRYRPWMAVHTEVFATKGEAMAREKPLKSSRVKSAMFKSEADSRWRYPS